MTKVKVCTIALAMCGLSFLSSCKSELLENRELKQDVKNEITSSKQKLLDYAVTGNYKIDEEQIQKDVLIAFSSMNNNSSTARSAGQKVTLSKIQSEKYEVPQQLKSARSAAVESYEDIDFSVYEINSGSGKSFAITSNDRRIGEIIAIADGEFETDISENPFMQIVAAGLENHINRTIDEWNSLTDEEVNTARTAASDWTPQNCTFYDAKYKDGNLKYLLKTKWDQKGYYELEGKIWDNPYNDAIQYVYKKDFYEGCPTIALAQILANYYYRHKEKKTPVNDTIYNKLNTIRVGKNSYESYGMQNWNRIKEVGWTDRMYDWSEILKNETLYDLTEKGQVQLQTFLYEVAEEIGVNYGIDKTGASHDKVRTALSTLGFNSILTDYHSRAVKTSLREGLPIYIEGYSTWYNEKKKEKFLWWETGNIIETDNIIYDCGHAWVIDGWANLQVTAWNFNIEEEKTFSTNFMHCNLGWGGDANGYYMDGIFDTNSSILEDDEVNRSAGGVPCNFQYKLKLITHIGK